MIQIYFIFSRQGYWYFPLLQITMKKRLRLLLILKKTLKVKRYAKKAGNTHINITAIYCQKCNDLDILYHTCFTKCDALERNDKCNVLAFNSFYAFFLIISFLYQFSYDYHKARPIKI